MTDDNSGYKIPWVTNDKSIIRAGLYFHGGGFGTLARSFIPKVAFALLLSRGILYIEAEAASEGEHIEAVEALKAEHVPFAEDSRTYWRDRPRFVFLNEKVKYTLPVLYGEITKGQTLERLFQIYNSWQHSTDFYILASGSDLPNWKDLFKKIGREIPSELFDKILFLIITAQEHGIMILSRKLSRLMIEGRVREVLAPAQVQLIVKEKVGGTRRRFSSKKPSQNQWRPTSTRQKRKSSRSTVVQGSDPAVRGRNEHSLQASRIYDVSTLTWWARPDSNRGPSGFPNLGL